ncbi:hypothetical protein ABBQ38_000222 [Trebouxia sp. C0009 RCD-2024]
MRCTFRLVRDYRLVPAVLFVEECCVEARKLTVAKNGLGKPPRLPVCQGRHPLKAASLGSGVIITVEHDKHSMHSDRLG